MAGIDLPRHRGRFRVKVLVIDNYDSFTFNLVQYIGELGADPVVYRNDELPPAKGAELKPDRLVISPGPGRPEAAGFSIEYVKTLGLEVPTLGVCLGHQAIAVAFGGEVGRAPEPRHGKTSDINHDGVGWFAGLSNPFVATRYHSLAAVELPDVLVPTAHSEDGVVQGIRHRKLPIEGVQFHPESVMTTEGMAYLKNFLG
ncbi:MAG: aminodeoxychorismate/anthranilate synthase component II [Acidimicrobiia bacterium]|nr:aminodeoxychorismate/anthranilate synthase component II [Acidimicrobiia bacterium]NNK92414.1 aminodeoxychorismate/anthranilate synthase component II [Acidimicrobiia bacterium]